MFVYYVGLLLFALNGLIWMAQRSERKEALAREDRLKELLTRKKLRNRRH
jgi:predicted GIY-YIG superfamily endonuclease